MFRGVGGYRDGRRRARRVEPVRREGRRQFTRVQGEFTRSNPIGREVDEGQSAVRRARRRELGGLGPLAGGDQCVLVVRHQTMFGKSRKCSPRKRP